MLSVSTGLAVRAARAGTDGAAVKAEARASMRGTVSAADDGARSASRITARQSDAGVSDGGRSVFLAGGAGDTGAARRGGDAYESTSSPPDDPPPRPRSTASRLTV